MRAIVLLIILSGLAIFALQNLMPIPLVILGLKTQALPLAVWVLGAIAAGAFTTIFISTLFKVSNSFATPRSRRPSAQRAANRVSSTSASSTSSASSWSMPWSSSEPKPKPPTTSASRSRSSMGDDWEPRPPLEEWEDWEGYEETPKPSPASSRYQADAQPYRTSSEPENRYGTYGSTQPAPEREEWEDWEDDEQGPSDREPVDRPRRDRDEDYVPRRTDFEVPQEPKSRSQSGSIYSYSYRDPNEATVGKTEDVYDAEYRVITPPYRPLEEPSVPDEPIAPDDEDDWGDEDDYGDGDYKDRRDRP